MCSSHSFPILADKKLEKRSVLSKCCHQTLLGQSKVIPLIVVLVTCLTNVKVLVHKIPPQWTASAEDEWWSSITNCMSLLSNTELTASSLWMFLGSCSVLLQSESWFVTPEIQDGSANSLLRVLWHEMWVSVDLVSRVSWWQGPRGDIREQGVSSCPSVLSSAAELRLEFHKDNYSQQQRHI